MLWNVVSFICHIICVGNFSTLKIPCELLYIATEMRDDWRDESAIKCAKTTFESIHMIPLPPQFGAATKDIFDIFFLFAKTESITNRNIISCDETLLKHVWVSDLNRNAAPNHCGTTSSGNSGCQKLSSIPSEIQLNFQNWFVECKSFCGTKIYNNAGSMSMYVIDTSDR